jgi:LPXTG-site transpeptidase (sortase) family protein
MKLINFFKYFFIISVAFFAGLSLGYYYHPELSVLLNGFFPEESLPSKSPALFSPAETFTLDLPDITEPLPLIFSETLDEPTIQEHLKNGAVVLPLGTNLGEPGNVVITAHSTGTAAFGPYRFAFAKLAELENGQTIVVKTPSADYTYQVYGREIVWPHEVDKLPQDDRPTLTLVTCWPLWTNFKRLLVNTELIKTEYH